MFLLHILILLQKYKWFFKILVIIYSQLKLCKVAYFIGREIKGKLAHPCILPIKTVPYQYELICMLIQSNTLATEQ